MNYIKQSERLDLLKEYLKVKTDSELGELIGSRPAQISRFRAGQKFGASFLNGVLSVAEGINREWLMHGKGKMIIKDEDVRKENVELKRKILEMKKILDSVRI